MVRIALVLTILLVSSAGFAQNTPDSVFTTYERAEDPDFAGPPDTVRVTIREFAQTKVDSLKADPDLNYAQPPTIAETLWDRFLQWLNRIFEIIFEKSTATDLGRFLIYTGLLIAIIIIILTLLRVNAFQLFYSGADTPQAYQVFHENIHEMNFELLIQQATDKKEYRLATRLVFLYALKLLSDKQLIEFLPGKTNHDYVEALQVGEIRTGLNELSFYFDYAWYGNFSISETQFEKIKNTFTLWRGKMV